MEPILTLVHRNLGVCQHHRDGRMCVRRRARGWSCSKGGGRLEGGKGGGRDCDGGAVGADDIEGHRFVVAMVTTLFGIVGTFEGAAELFLVDDLHA